jgi:hypothetical protein
LGGIVQSSPVLTISVTGNGGPGILDLLPAKTADGNPTANIVSGYTSNSVGAAGATVAGGGANCTGCANSVTGDFGTVSGGRGNTAGRGSAVPGGEFNSATGLESTVGGGVGNTASGIYYATVGGGYANSAGGAYSTVGGGENNVAGDVSTVGGGQNNAASNSSSVTGGFSNKASGQFSTVPGGSGNTAGGDYSFAAGWGATASHPSSFVWCQTDGAACGSLGSNSFVVSVLGPIYFFDGPGGSGCNLVSGGGSWNCSSDRNLKNDVVPAVRPRFQHCPPSTHRARSAAGRAAAPFVRLLALPASGLPRTRRGPAATPPPW